MNRNYWPSGFARRANSFSIANTIRMYFLRHKIGIDYSFDARVVYRAALFFINIGVTIIFFFIIIPRILLSAAAILIANIAGRDNVEEKRQMSVTTKWEVGKLGKLATTGFKQTSSAQSPSRRPGNVVVPHNAPRVYPLHVYIHTCIYVCALYTISPDSAYRACA